jgi:hypothetical protein
MRQKLGWTLGALLLLALPLAVTAGHDNHFVSTGDADLEKFDLSELADGETRIFGEGEDRVTATRNGDRITLELPERDGDKPRMIDCTVGKGSCYVMTMGEGKGQVLFLGDAAHVGHAGSFSWSGDVHGVHEDGKVVVVRSLSADGAGLSKIVELSAGSDVSIYECPEGDTTMRLEKDDSGPYFCPKHGGELVERDITEIHRNIRVLMDAHEVD